MRLMLRRTLRRMLDEHQKGITCLTADQFAAVERVYLRPRMMGALLRRIEEKVETDRFDMALGDGKFLEWLWENREAILAFILKIVDLFS